MGKITDLVIATANPGKVAEICVLLGDLPIKVWTLADFSKVEAVEESGTSYEANALIKARAYARQTGLWSLADDSGFEVMALGGQPGVYSARYAGVEASDDERIKLLLRQFEAGESRDRRARFVCVAALANPENKTTRVAKGIVEGTVINEPRGHHGFGYDPIFVPDGFEKTFAELSPEIKNVISHRARAIKAMRGLLEELLGGEGIASV